MASLTKLLSASEMDAIGNARLFTALHEDNRISNSQRSSLTKLVGSAPDYVILQRTPKGATFVQFPDGSELRMTQAGKAYRVYPY
jgi:hypothetical protein